MKKHVSFTAVTVTVIVITMFSIVSAPAGSECLGPYLRAEFGECVEGYFLERGVGGVGATQGAITLSVSSLLFSSLIKPVLSSYTPPTSDFVSIWIVSSRFVGLLFSFHLVQSLSLSVIFSYNLFSPLLYCYQLISKEWIPPAALFRSTMLRATVQIALFLPRMWRRLHQQQQ